MPIQGRIQDLRKGGSYSMSAKREYHPARSAEKFGWSRPLINHVLPSIKQYIFYEMKEHKGKTILLGCLFEVEGGEMVVTGGETVVTGGETVVAPSGETVVAGGYSEEETGCRLVELDASSKLIIIIYSVCSVYAVPCTLPYLKLSFS